MTRINTIDPSDLTDEWLLAEWRELPRIPNSILSGKAKIDFKKIPDHYRLGAGHVMFFYNKLNYLQKRHVMICKELDKRNIKRDPLVTVDLSSLDNVLRACLCKGWQPSQKDHNVNIERLQERFDSRKRAYHMTINNVKQKIDCEHSFNQYCDQQLKKYYD